jgi:hypothetical protein
MHRGRREAKGAAALASKPWASWHAMRLVCLSTCLLVLNMSVHTGNPMRAWSGDFAQSSKAATFLPVGGTSRKSFLPEMQWYQTLLPPKSTWKSVYAPAGLISKYSSTWRETASCHVQPGMRGRRNQGNACMH